MTDIAFDFEVVSYVSINAPKGTDPDTLLEQARTLFAERTATGEAEVMFFQTFDSETGEYNK